MGRILCFPQISKDETELRGRDQIAIPVHLSWEIVILNELSVQLEPQAWNSQGYKISLSKSGAETS